MSRKPKRVPRINHAEHNHPQTARYSVLCRRQVIETGEPLDVDAVENETVPEEETLTRGQKAARTRAANKAAAERATALDAVLDLTDEVSDDIVPDLTGARHPMAEEARASVALDKGEGGTYSIVSDTAGFQHRNSRGRFTRDTLDQWNSLLNSMEGAHDYLVTEGAELLGAVLTIDLGGHHFKAEFDGSQWSVEVQD